MNVTRGMCRVVTRRLEDELPQTWPLLTSTLLQRCRCCASVREPDANVHASITRDLEAVRMVIS